MSCAVVIPGMLRDDTCILHDALRLKKGEQERQEGRTDGRKGRKEGRKEGIYKKGRPGPFCKTLSGEVGILIKDYYY